MLKQARQEKTEMDEKLKTLLREEMKDRM